MMPLVGLTAAFFSVVVVIATPFIGLLVRGLQKGSPRTGLTTGTGSAIVSVVATAMISEGEPK